MSSEDPGSHRGSRTASCHGPRQGPYRYALHIRVLTGAAGRHHVSGPRDPAAASIVPAEGECDALLLRRSS